MIVTFDHPVAGKLRGGGKVSASWVQTGSNVASEILAEAGFDVIVADMEHSPLGLEKLVGVLQSAKGTGCLPFVRVPWNDMVILKQVLDAGAMGVHVPYVSTGEEAAYAVKSCRYPPEGWRGIAGSQRAVSYSLSKQEYYRNANDNVIVMVAIETPEGVDNIDEIASTPGLDGIFVGPGDLSTCMGHLGDPSQPDVQQAIREIEMGAKRHGKFLGTVAPDMDRAADLYDLGYQLVYFSSDTVTLATQATKELKAFRAYLDKKR